MRTFPEEMKLLLSDRKMSASVAAAELGYSSKTALLRILNGESKPSSYRKCFDAAVASAALALTKEEIDGLEKALQVSTMGRQAYALNVSLQNLLKAGSRSSSPVTIPLSGREDMDTVEDLLAHISNLSSTEIILFGKCPPELLARISRITETGNIRSIQHIIAVQRDNADDILAVGETSHIIFNELYSLFVYINTQGVATWAFHSGMIFFSGRDSEDRLHTFFITPLPLKGYHVLYDHDGSIVQLRDRILSESAPFIKPIKRNLGFNNHPFPINYMNFTREYCRLEINREIHTIKPDIPFHSIPTGLLFPIIIESFSSISPVSETDPVITELYDIHRSRHENLLCNSKITHIILKRQAMENFARTGVLQDHFYLLRPFTPQERMTILSTLIDAMLRNPMFHIWFSKQPSLFSDMEVTAYENHALAILDANTSWNLQKNHQEILLEGKLLSTSFKNYVMHLVQDGGVLPREESIRILRELIEIAANA